MNDASPPNMCRRHDSPSETIEYNSAPVQRATFHDSGSKMLAVIALVAACLALGAVSMYVILAAQIIDAKIEAGTASANSTANVARVDARYALAEVEHMRTELAANGIKVSKQH